MATAAERKRAQRARAAAGAVSAEVIRKKLVEHINVLMDLWCRDTSRPEPTISQIIDAVAEDFPVEERARVFLYLGYPRSEDVNPDDV